MKMIKGHKDFCEVLQHEISKNMQKTGGGHFGHISPLKRSKNTADSFNVCYILHKYVTTRDKKEKLANTSSVLERISVYKFSLLWQRMVRA